MMMEEDMGDGGAPPDDAEMHDNGGRPDQPGAYEFRLLLSAEIAKDVETGSRCGSNELPDPLTNCRFG
jgi:hypothetical protein